MALYTIGEVALLCDINPVTLRAWQRRYGLLKPQRTDGGHRLFNDADIDRIREIKSWIDNGVQVGKVKSLLSQDDPDTQHLWREQQETLLRLLQSGNLQRLRGWIKEQGRDYPAQTLITHLFIPLRRRLQCQQTTLQALLSMLDGVLINYISVCLASARNKNIKDALVIGTYTIPPGCGSKPGLPPSRAGALTCLPTPWPSSGRNCLRDRRCWSGAAKSPPLPSSSSLRSGANMVIPFTHWVQMRRNGI